MRAIALRRGAWCGGWREGTGCQDVQVMPPSTPATTADSVSGLRCDISRISRGIASMQASISLLRPAQECKGRWGGAAQHYVQ
jgi:hypothetical protein